MYSLCLFQLGELGKGAGKGGGGGGSVREAGGAFGKREVAEEERYFRWDTSYYTACLHASSVSHKELLPSSSFHFVGRRRGSRWKRWGSITQRRLSITKRRLSAYRRKSTVIRAKSESSNMTTEAGKHIILLPESPTILLPSQWLSDIDWSTAAQVLYDTSLI